MPSPCTDSVSLPHHVSFFFVGGVCEIAYVYVGLKYDDILIESDPDVALATKRLSDADRQARDRRLKRALDISFKKKPLPLFARAFRVINRLSNRRAWIVLQLREEPDGGPTSSGFLLINMRSGIWCIRLESYEP